MPTYAIILLDRIRIPPIGGTFFRIRDSGHYLSQSQGWLFLHEISQESPFSDKIATIQLAPGMAGRHDILVTRGSWWLPRGAAEGNIAAEHNSSGLRFFKRKIRKCIFPSKFHEVSQLTSFRSIRSFSARDNMVSEVGSSTLTPFNVEMALPCNSSVWNETELSL
jgi:hypothetical protein